MIRALAPVCACDDVERETDHELVGFNLVERPVWECLECGDRRVGPFAFGEADAEDRQPVATDGGSDQ